MNKRAMMLAVVFAVLGAVLMILYVKRFEEEASGGERVRVLMAVKPIEPGTVLDDELLTVREIPIAYVEDRFIKAAEKSKIVGLRLGIKLEAQQTLMWTDLAIASDEQRDLSALIQPGSRAVFIRARQGEKGYALIKPGDYVDVIANMPVGNDRAERKALVLVQKVLVLAVGMETTTDKLLDKSGLRVGEQALTLSVTLQEAQLLSLAAERGELLVALRNPDDQRILEGIPDMTSAALSDTAILKQVQGARKSSRPIRLEANR